MTCPEPCTAATIKPIFHSPSQARKLLRRPQAALNRFADYVERAAKLLTDPNGAPFHLWHLMPPPSYEYAWGLQLPPEDNYTLPFAIKRNGMLVLQLEPRSRAEIRFGGKTFQIRRTPKDRYVIDYEGQASRQDGAFLYLTLRLWNGQLWYSASGHLLCAADPVDFDPSVVVSCKAGSVFIVSAQSLDGTGHFLQFPGAYPDDERIVQVSDERNPFRFDWGLRSCTLLNMLIGIAVARDLLSVADTPLDDELQNLCRRLAVSSDLDDTLRFLLSHILKWPHWRPAAGDYPESAAWDRNSFTNGTLPAIVALLARLTRREADEELIERFHDRGTAFLNSSTRGGFLTFRARDQDHWVRRSANHGLIMLSAYLIGARLLNQMHRSDVRQIDLTFGLAIHRLLEDGSFCEGVAYEFFALSYLLPYIHLFGDEHSYDEQRSIRTLRPLLGKSYDWVSLNHDQDGHVFGNFGDNFTDKIRRVSLFSYFQSCTESRLEIPCRYAEWSDEQFSFAPAPRFERSPGRRIEARLYPINQTYLATAYSDDGERLSGLFVIGSKLQRTHNRNHDCGGFSFYWGNARVEISKSEQEAHLNNAVAFMEDGKIVPHDGPRAYTGSVHEISAGAEHVRLQTHAVLGRGFMKGRPRAEVNRIFTFRPYTNTPLTIETRVHGPTHLHPFLAFQLKGFTTGDDGTSKWCRTFLRKDSRYLELPAQETDDLCAYIGEPTADGATVFLTIFGEGDLDPEVLPRNAQARSLARPELPLQAPLPPGPEAG